MEKQQSSLSDCKTLDQLYEAIRKVLISPKCEIPTKNEFYEQHYNSARLVAINFRNICPELQIVPDHNNNNALAGLQNIMQWCVESKETMRKLILDIDKQSISKAINLLEKLKILPDTEFPLININIWNNAVHRAQRIVERLAKKQRSHNWRLGNSFKAYESRFRSAAHIISEFWEVSAKKKEQSSKIKQSAITGIPRNNDTFSQEWEKAFTEIQFLRAIVKMYLIMDDSFNRGLIKLEQNITDMLRQLNELRSAIQYPLNAYDTLMGIGLQENFNGIERAYETQTLIDWNLFGSAAGTLLYYKPRKELVDNTIDLLIGILGIKKRPDEIQNLKDFIQDNLRKAIHTEPQKEQDVQDVIETLLIGRGLKKGLDYDREVGRVKISIKEVVPDFIFPELNTALEVKLSKNQSKSKTIVDEINADIEAYSKKYSSLIFLVYDLGTIRNVQEFKQGLETDTVSILVVKH